MAARIIRLALTLALLAAAPASAQVLYVGDSLGVGTAPQLAAQLPEVELDQDSETSRPSAVGLDVLAQRLAPEHRVVVFDLGTNDDPGAPEALAANLAEARELAGERCLVVATVNRPPLNGIGAEGLNRALTRFAAQSRGVQLVDWHAAAAADPGLLSDGIHPRPEGYGLRAQLFAEAIDACLTSARPPSAPPEPPAPKPAENAPRPAPEPAPRPQREPGPMRALAIELARTIAIGAEFG